MRHLVIPSCLLYLVPLGGLLPAEEDGYQQRDGTAGLGVLTRPVPLGVQADNDLSPGEGTVVRRVFPGTAADDIGLRRGDVIVAIDGTATNSRRDLRETVWANQPGDVFTVQVLRDGQQLTMDGTYSRIPDWLESRLRLPGERWESHVERRQRSFLDWVDDQLDQAEALAEGSHAAQAAAAELASEGLPPLHYDARASDGFRAVLGLVGDDEPWSFSYHWEVEAGDEGEVEL